MQAFERYAFPILAVIFLVAAVTILTKTDTAAGGGGSSGSLGGFLLTVGATFGYAAGWNPYAADYTRYFRPDTSPRATGWAAGLGVFVSCVLLETVGAASATIGGDPLGDPTGSFTGLLPSVTANLTLLAIALGAVSANALNVYSGAMSFVALGVNLPLAARRAISALGFGVIGFVVAITGLNDAGAKYESFLLVIAYWIGPWLGVVFTDQALRRGQPIERFLYDKHVRQLGRAGRDAARDGRVDPAVLQPDPVRRVRRQAVVLVRRHRLRGRVRRGRGDVLPGPDADPTAARPRT